jgi:glucosamine-6-phosphate deaminase
LRVQVLSSAPDAAAAAAEAITRAITDRPNLVLTLPAGRTPVLIYRELVRISRAQAAGWSGVRTFNLDEFVTAPESASLGMQPYQRFMRDHLFSHIELPDSQIHSPNGRASDSDAECERYERAIEQAGGIDLALLGLGANGHIAFNEPAAELAARTHLVRLPDATRRSNAWLFGGNGDAVPSTALTMGMGTILRARRIILVATGEEKAAAVAAMLGGAIATALPASFLQLHADVTVWLDPAAAGGLATRP